MSGTSCISVSRLTHNQSCCSFSANGSLPLPEYTKPIKLQYWRGGGGHSGPGWGMNPTHEGTDLLFNNSFGVVKRAASEDAKAILILCDLWTGNGKNASAGSDSTATAEVIASGAPAEWSNFDRLNVVNAAGTCPGDNGDWTSYDAMVDELIVRAKALDSQQQASIQWEVCQ